MDGQEGSFVFVDAAKRGYNVVITRDRNQFDDPKECDAIKKSRVHHVSYRQRPDGPVGFGLALGAVIAAMPSVIAALSKVGAQRLVRIAGLDPKQRYEMFDPKSSPPSAYWR